MLQCPICKERKGSYYKATSEALGDLVDLMPGLSDGMEHWLFLDGTPQGFADDRSGREVRPTKDLMLVLICKNCATRARSKLKLSYEDFEQLQADQCPCCGYYTLLPYFSLCSVCFWEDDGGEFGGPHGVTLEEAQQNFKVFGAMAPEFRLSVRPPRPEEHPRYHE